MNHGARAVHCIWASAYTGIAFRLFIAQVRLIFPASSVFPNHPSNVCYVFVRLPISHRLFCLDYEYSRPPSPLASFASSRFLSSGYYILVDSFPDVSLTTLVMGVDCSKPSREYTELYLPSDTFRVCTPDRCWCQGGHRSSRYMYVERGGDGRERFHDPQDYMDRFMMGGGWPSSWKDPGEWTTRDYERLGEIMSEYQNRMRGRQMSPWGAMPFVGMAGAALPAMMMGADSPFKMPREHHRTSRRSSWEHEIMQRIKRMEEIAKEYEERVTGMSNHLYGTDAERQEEMYKRRQNKLWQEFQQAQMGMPMGGGMGMGMGGMPMGGNPMMAQQAGLGMPGFGGVGGGMGAMGMPGYGGGGMGAMGGLGGFGGMNPTQGMGRRASMMGMGDGEMLGGLGGMAGGLGGGMGGGMGGLGGVGGMGRRGGRRARRNISLGDDEAEDDDFGGGFGGGGGMGRRARRRRGGFDEGDFFAGFGDGE